MSIFQQISAILSSVQSGTPLTASQYETLAKSSEAETKQAVGANAPIIEDAYNSYVQNVVLADNKDYRFLFPKNKAKIAATITPKELAADHPFTREKRES